MKTSAWLGTLSSGSEEDLWRYSNSEPLIDVEPDVLSNNRLKDLGRLRTEKMDAK